MMKYHFILSRFSFKNSLRKQNNMIPRTYPIRFVYVVHLFVNIVVVSY